MFKIVLISVIINCSTVLLSLLHDTDTLRVGELCGLPDYTKGICTRIELCQSAIDGLKRGIRPQQCTFEGSTSIVCCVKDTLTSLQNTTTEYSNVMGAVANDRSFGNVSLEKCKDYANLVYLNHSSPTLLIDVLYEIEDTCAIKQENYNDSTVLAREFPHLASIGYDSGTNQLWKCSGALISQQHVITSASCENLPTLGLAKYVRLGSTSARENFYHERPLQYINIEEFIKHPKFDDRTLVHNIAIIKLQVPVKFNSIVRPACLGANSKYVKEAMNVGWGTFDRSYMNNEPLKNLMRILDPKRCKNLQATQICVEEVPGDARQNCLADQGSALQVYNQKNYCTYDIIGVLSNWRDCQLKKYGLYTNISSYIPWIEKIVWKS